MKFLNKIDMLLIQYFIFHVKTVYEKWNKINKLRIRINFIISISDFP